MASITLRSLKGSPLTIKEMDDNFSNINIELGTKLPSTSYTAADVLTKIKTVDGAGSGLDADLLDGRNSATAATANTVALRDAGGNLVANTFNGNLAGNVTSIGTSSFSNITSSGSLAITGGLTLNGSSGIAGQVMVSAGSGNTPTWGSPSSFISGMIIMWSGLISNIPSGWYLCDGNNGTPDLRNRMVIGAGSLYSVGSTGGNKDAIVPAHTHTVNDPGHSHTYLNKNVLQSDRVGNDDDFVNWNSTATGTTSTATTDISINVTGSSATNANLPPYYALAFIMKA